MSVEDLFLSKLTHMGGKLLLAVGTWAFPKKLLYILIAWWLLSPIKMGPKRSKGKASVAFMM